MYISPEDLTALFGAEETEDVTIERLTLAITTAQEIIDNRLAATHRFIVPLDPVPSLIKSIAVDIARYNYDALGRPYNSDVQSQILGRYENALKILENIATLKIQIGDLAMQGEVRSEQILVSSKPREWL